MFLTVLMLLWSVLNVLWSQSHFLWKWERGKRKQAPVCYNSKSEQQVFHSLLTSVDVCALWHWCHPDWYNLWEECLTSRMITCDREHHVFLSNYCTESGCWLWTKCLFEAILKIQVCILQTFFGLCESLPNFFFVSGKKPPQQRKEAERPIRVALLLFSLSLGTGPPSPPTSNLNRK